MRHIGGVYGMSKGRRPGSKLYYRRVYSASDWNTFLRGWSKGTLLQVCCGGSPVGGVRVDRDPAAPTLNLQGDMFRLPFPDRAFKTVACDPPYELDYRKRVLLQRELARIADERIIFKAPWIPRATWWKLTETVLIASHTCSNISVMSVLDRQSETASLFPKQTGGANGQ